MHFLTKVATLKTHLCKDPGRESKKISLKKNMIEKLKDIEASFRSSHIYLIRAPEGENRENNGKPLKI